MKHSGVGSRFGSVEGILRYCRAQAISSPRMPTQSSELLWYPYSRQQDELCLRHHPRGSGTWSAAYRGHPRVEARDDLFRGGSHRIIPSWNIVRYRVARLTSRVCAITATG